MPAPPQDQLQYAPPIISPEALTGPVYILLADDGDADLIGLPANLYTLIGSGTSTFVQNSPAFAVNAGGDLYVQYLNSDDAALPFDVQSINFTPATAQAPPITPAAWLSLNSLAMQLGSQPQAMATIVPVSDPQQTLYCISSSPIGSSLTLALADGGAAQCSFIVIAVGEAGFPSAAGGILGGPGGSTFPMLQSPPCAGTMNQSLCLYALTTTNGLSLECYVPPATPLSTPVMSAWSVVNSQIGGASAAVESMLLQQTGGGAAAAVPFDADGSLLCYATALQAFGTAITPLLGALAQIGNDVPSVQNILTVANNALAASSNAGFALSDVVGVILDLSTPPEPAMAAMLGGFGWDPLQILSALIPVYPLSPDGPPYYNSPVSQAVQLLPISYPGQVGTGTITFTQVVAALNTLGYTPADCVTALLYGVTNGGLSEWWWNSPAVDKRYVQAAVPAIAAALQGGYTDAEVASSFFEVSSSQNTDPNSWVFGDGTGVAILSCYKDVLGDYYGMLTVSGLLQSAGFTKPYLAPYLNMVYLGVP